MQEMEPFASGGVHLNGRELLFGEARELKFFCVIACILSPLAAVAKEKSQESINPIPEMERMRVR